MTDSKHEQMILDGSAWDEFCDGLKATGRLVQAEGTPADAFNKAEGYRYLTRLLRGALESYVEFGDRSFPVLRSPCHETIKMGADNPDNYYQSAPINPDFDYRIVGTRGSVDYLGISTVINRYASGGTMETTGFLDSRELQMDATGNLEIILSQRQQPGNWLPMTAETNSVNVRQTFKDQAGETRAEIRLERVAANDARPSPLTPEQLVRSLQGVTQFMRGTSQLFENWSESFVPSKNQLPAADQAYCQAIGGDPNIFYFHSYWELADDEVLILRADSIPECQTWNFQLDNWWMESLDYRYHRIHHNQHTAALDADGSVTLVIAHRDPGHANWIETAGHHNGTMCWRWIGASEHPPVDARVLKIDALGATLANLGK